MNSIFALADLVYPGAGAVLQAAGHWPSHLVVFLAGFALGCMWYRKTLKNNPVKLAALVEMANAVGKPIEDAARTTVGK